MGLKNYSRDVNNYYNETDMKNKVGTMCHLYEFNDTKLYKRMTLMMAVDNLEEHVEQYLDSTKNLKDIKADGNYHKTDIA